MSGFILYSLAWPAHWIFAHFLFAFSSGIALSFWVNYGLLDAIGDVDLENQRIWRVPFALQHLPGLLLVVTMLFEKESPRWLGERGRWEDAKAVIARLSRKSIDHPDVVQEADEIKADLEKNVRISIVEQFRQATSSGKMFYRCSLPVIMWVLLFCCWCPIYSYLWINVQDGLPTMDRCQQYELLFSGYFPGTRHAE